MPTECRILEYERVVADRYPDLTDLANKHFKGQYNINSDDVIKIQWGLKFNSIFIRCN